MIQQHYYTRERNGIYSKTPGYDTIAKSVDLEDEFIKDKLHSLCYYEAPSELAGEEDTKKYPVSLFYLNTEDGRMIIGQSSFVGKDYTGQRNRYFTHNYIINSEKRMEFIRDPEKIIYSGGFVTDYDISKGSKLLDLSSILEDTSMASYDNIQSLYSATGLSKDIFIRLIKASFDGARFGKKIYVVLDVDYSNITELAKEMLKFLFRALPFEVRRNLGFITYMKEPKNKDGIDLIFLTKGSIKRITTEIKAGYVFDFADKNFYLDGIDEEEYEFLHYIINNIENKEILLEFFEKLDSMPMEYKLDISHYDKFIWQCQEKERSLRYDTGEEIKCHNTEEVGNSKPKSSYVETKNSNDNNDSYMGNKEKEDVEETRGNLADEDYTVSESSARFGAFIRKVKSFINNIKGST